MALIVQKYGGTSVANIERIKNVAKRVVMDYDKGNDMVVILSAKAGVTDDLLKQAREAASTPDKRETDVLLTTGEQVTVALLAIVLKGMGYKATSLLGFQIPIKTSSMYSNSRIMEIKTERIKALLDEKQIVVIAGFQGFDADNNLTTLGRGGSDTSAVAVAAALKADKCEIFTDVDGVYTTDPNVCKKAKKIDKIFSEEILEMASLGAKVLHLRSVEFALKHNVPVFVRSSFNMEEGTMIVNDDHDLERPVVTGVTYNKNEAQVTLRRIPDQPGIAAKILKPIADKGINVDMIVQNTHSGGFTDLTFTVPITDFKETLEMARAIGQEIGAENILGDEFIAKVSVVGVGMKSHSGVAAKMFETLAKENINIMMISTSEIRISCVIDERKVELAVRSLHTAFGLDKEE